MPSCLQPSVLPRLNRSRICRFLSLRFCLSLLWLLLAQLPAQAFALELSAEERAWIQAHPRVGLCVDPDWWPFERVDEQDEYIGIAADLIALVTARTGLHFDRVSTVNWEASLRASQAGECQALSLLNRSPEREQWLLFTAPLLEDANVFITREEHPFIINVGELAGERIALPRGTAVSERFARDYPQLEIVYTESEAQALALVSERKVDITLRSLIVAADTIRREGWFNLKIAGQLPGYENRLRMGVVKSQPMLRDILDKGIATLSVQERRQIIDRHVPLRMVAEVITDYTLVYALLAVLGAVVLTSLFWMRRLRTLNRQLETLAETDPLTGVANRNALHGFFAHSLRSALRFARPLSVIMLDIDHFKRINDEHGHLRGDRALAAFAAIIRSNLRDVDTVVRWGGEEFLIIGQETSLTQAEQLAERILAATRTQAVDGDLHITASAGVATARPGDSIDALVQRADTALYAAKHAGRDQVCSAAETSGA